MLQNYSVGPSGMWAEHLRMWLNAASWEESPDDMHWWKVVGLVQTIFQERKLMAECMWKTLLPILKIRGDLLSIVLFKFLCKMVMGIMNLWNNLVIDFHYTLHGFPNVKGTGTASLEAKLLQDLA